MVANILPADPLPPPPTLGTGLIGQTSTFSEHVMLHIQLKGISKCSSMEANILPADPYPTPANLGKGQIGQDSTFSEHGHVAFQIKEIHKCSYMGSKILPADPRDPGDGSKGQDSTFENIVMLHIKF